MDGLRQIAAEELDVSVSSRSTFARSTRRGSHPQRRRRQHGSAATGWPSGGPPLRQAAAAARGRCSNLASAQLGVPVASLTVTNGVVSGGGQSVKYGDLLGRQALQHDDPAADATTDRRRSKPVSQYKVVGTRVPRFDIPAKVTGKYTYVHNVRVPGMLHGRIVRPRGQAYLTATAAAAREPPL